MKFQPKGRFVNISYKGENNALGICDYSGLVFNKKDLVKQMEWRGNALVWTGYLVGRPFLDVPNEQNRPPILPPDPVPVPLPRVMQNQTVTWNQNFNVTWENLNFCTWEQWESLEDGTSTKATSEIMAALENVYWGA